MVNATYKYKQKAAIDSLPVKTGKQLPFPNEPHLSTPPQN